MQEAFSKLDSKQMNEPFYNNLKAMAKSKIAISILSQTNTALPVLLYIKETIHLYDKVILLINSQHLAHKKSRTESESAIKYLIRIIIPTSIIKVLNTSIPRKLSINNNRFKKILGIWDYRKQLKQEISEIVGKPLGQLSCTFVSDTGIRNLCLFGIRPLNAQLILVPHEMRHHTEYSSDRHARYWGVDNRSDNKKQRFERSKEWLLYRLCGCSIPKLYSPHLEYIFHVSYNNRLEWCKNSKVLDYIHDKYYYKKIVQNCFADIPSEKKELAVLVILSQASNMPGGKDAYLKKYKEALSDLHKLLPNHRIYVKPHPQELGMWDEYIAYFTKDASYSVSRNKKYIWLPCELLFALHKFDHVIVHGSGGGVVAKEMYSIPTKEISL